MIRKVVYRQSIQNKKVLIIGATGDIGSETARLIKQSGGHLYLSGRDESKLQALATELNLNDTPAGLSPDTQIDNERELPGATGLIDSKSFLEALVILGYDRPVRAEPFNRILKEMEDVDVLLATRQAIQKCVDML